VVSRVGVVGAGYVGLTTAACLAHLGHEVVCGDIDVEKLARLSRGEVPILEDGLTELVAEGLRSARLSFVLGAAAAAVGREFVFLCVPTPQGADASADLSHVEEAITEIAPVIEPGAVVVAKSTMPPGSSRAVGRLLERAGARSRDIGVASNPEFLREGRAVHDFLHPDRIVIGCEEPDVAVRVSALYRGIQAPLLVTDCGSAEMIKYASNTFLATKVSFVNAIANLCEALDADVRAVTLGMGYDPRIGFDFLRPGPGYGGSCLPKDTAALIRAAEDVGYDFSLLRGVEAVNRAQHERIVEKIRAVAGSFDGARVAVWGLTFKADTDDLRDSPALVVVERLLEEGALVAAFDPAAGDRAPEVLAARRPGEVVLSDVPAAVALVNTPGEAAHERGPLPTASGRYVPALPLERFFVASDPYEACRGAVVLAVLTEWDVFRWLDFDRVRHLLGAPVIVDARNLLDPTAMRRRGFDYHGVGR
jgi:UDPglucose 6-dehydrogenase